MVTELELSTQFFLGYELHQHGWATAVLTHGDNSVAMTASYLHDSLRELANSAYSISHDSSAVRVVFMDEPGEHQLTIQRINSAELEYSIVWFDDWDSWGMGQHTQSRELFTGRIPTRRFIQQVHSALWKVFDEFGEAGYKARWCEHDFPLAEMNRLA